MAKKLDKILVVDIEATCWEGEPRVGEVSEIIEVGACMLNLGPKICADDATIEDIDSLLVKPTQSKVSPFCTRLTTLTQTQVDKGVQFMDAVSWIRKAYLAQSYSWASWGDYDRKMFEKQCRDFSQPYPFGPTHINVKNLFAVSFGLSKEVNVDKALEILGLTFEGTPHRGVDDAKNIARILKETLIRCQSQPKNR